MKGVSFLDTDWATLFYSMARSVKLGFSTADDKPIAKFKANPLPVDNFVDRNAASLQIRGIQPLLTLCKKILQFFKNHTNQQLNSAIALIAALYAKRKTSKIKSAVLCISHDG